MDTLPHLLIGNGALCIGIGKPVLDHDIKSKLTHYLFA